MENEIVQNLNQGNIIYTVIIYTTVLIIIPAISAYIGGFIQHKFSQKTVRIDKQRECYERFFKALQYLINMSGTKGSDALTNFVQAFNEVLLFASPKTASVVNDYFLMLVDAENTKKIMDRETHEKYQDNLIRAMRKDLSLSNKKISPMKFVKINSK